MTRALVWRLTKSTTSARTDEAESIKLGVRLRATGVPIAERFPAACRWSKDIPLAGQDEIGLQRESEIFQSFLEQGNGTAGVDCPDGAAALQFPN